MSLTLMQAERGLYEEFARYGHQRPLMVEVPSEQTVRSRRAGVRLGVRYTGTYRCPVCGGEGSVGLARDDVSYVYSMTDSGSLAPIEPCTGQRSAEEGPCSWNVVVTRTRQDQVQVVVQAMNRAEAEALACEQAHGEEYFYPKEEASYEVEGVLIVS